MKPNAHFIMMLSAVAALATLSSCESKPESPIEPSRNTTNVGIDIIGPRTLAPGDTAPLRAVARRSDGTTVDVTSTVVWRSSAPDVLAITADGMATGLGAGDAFMTVVLDSLSASREIIVVPAGTFRVIGRVLEEGFPAFAVSRARIEVDAGAVWTMTDLNGHYRLHGVPARARLRISRDGYRTHELTLELTDHRSEDLFLSRAGPPLNPVGSYEMTFELSPTCRGRLPDELLIRRYQATLALRNSRDLQLTLQGATFAPGANVVRGRSSAGGLELTFQYDFYFYYGGGADLVEIIGPQSYLVLWALNDASLAVSPRGYSGTFSGGALLLDGDPRSRPRERVSCYATDHRVTLVR